MARQPLGLSGLPVGIGHRRVGYLLTDSRANPTRPAVRSRTDDPLVLGKSAATARSKSELTG